jgi:hypothetical protein
MNAANRRAEARSAGPAMRAAATREASGLKGQAAAAGRRVKAGTATRADLEAVAQWEGLTAGARLRERQRAAEDLGVLAALRAERQLTAAEAEAEAEATAILAEAERRAALAGRPRGRWVLANGDRMTSVELSRLCGQAARAELAARTRASGYRMPDAERAELLATVEAAMAAEAMQRAADVEAAALADLRWKVDARPHIEPARRAALARTADRWAVTVAEATRVMPLWDAPYVADATRGLIRRHADAEARYGAEAVARRDRWRAWLRNIGKRELEAVTIARRAEAAAEDDARTPAARMAEAEANVTALAAELEAAGRPLGVAERGALEAGLDGLTRRERAEANGTTLETEKKRAQRGRTALAARWPDLAAFRADLAAAAAAAEAEADREAAAEYGPVILAGRLIPRPVYGPVTREAARWVAPLPAFPAVPDFYGPGRPLAATHPRPGYCAPGASATLPPVLTPGRGPRTRPATPTAARAADRAARDRARVMAAPQARVTRASLRAADHAATIELARMAAELGRATGRTAEARATVAWLTGTRTVSPTAILRAVTAGQRFPTTLDTAEAVTVPARTASAPSGGPSEPAELTRQRASVAAAAERKRAMDERTRDRAAEGHGWALRALAGTGFRAS